MVRAYHAIFSCYGFWLPNDPRGSWSDWVRRWELLRCGSATKTEVRRSVAKRPHDREKRREAKTALRYSPVRLNGLQARAVVGGFARACDEGAYTVPACAVMPDHVHMVIARHDRRIEQVLQHMKARATQQLKAEMMHPLSNEVGDAEPPSPWARHGLGGVPRDDTGD